MIQPTLMSYTFDTPPMPVLFDSVSIKHVVILNTYVLHFRYSSPPMPILLISVSIKHNVILLDTFFHILIFHGVA